MTLQFGKRIATAEVAMQRKPGHIERIQREYVTVSQRVVPRRTRTVVAEIVSRHFLVTGEPSRVVVESLARAARRGRSRLAAGDDASRELATPDRHGVRREVNQHPMMKVHARQRRWYGAAVLVHVITTRWHVGIHANQCE